MNNQYSNKLIYGKNPLERIVSIEPKNDAAEIFLQDASGDVSSVFVDHRYWMLTPYKADPLTARLKGDLHYKFGKQWKSEQDFLEARKKAYRYDAWSVGTPKEAMMIKDGYTYYKGLTPKEVTVLSFDIETTGLKHNKDSFVVLIANTFRKNGVVQRRMFTYDEYGSQAEMINAWCAWVREVNPSILLGHNVLGYDMPYLKYVAEKNGTDLILGRNGSALSFNQKESKFRVDGTRDLAYKKVHCYGREIIDTMFLAIRYDIGRKYESYRLKGIIAQEGLEVKNRVFYDAENIRNTYKDKNELVKIKAYAEHDGDDALALFDLMSPAYFYMCQSVPKSFQAMFESASGSQLNAIMCRSYLQDGYSIPKAHESIPFEGAVSFGVPGIYNNCFKIDVASEYPSCILQYEIYDKQKDPKKHMLEILDYFTKSRLEYKRLAQETNNQYYKDMDSASKIFINSLYGFLGAQGLNFNSPECAALVTKKGREVIETALIWASGKGREYWQSQCITEET